MKLRSVLLGMAAGIMILAGTVFTAQAAVLTTGDGVLSIETPTEQWTQTTDPNHWFAVSNGTNIITVDHLSNGEGLPSVKVAEGNYGAVYQAFVSTKNEVFVVTGQAADNTGLQELMQIIGTIRVLKYDTKTAVQKTQDTVDMAPVQKTPQEKKSEETAAESFKVWAEDGSYAVIHAVGDHFEDDGVTDNKWYLVAGNVYTDDATGMVWSSVEDYFTIEGHMTSEDLDKVDADQSNEEDGSGEENGEEDYVEGPYSTEIYNDNGAVTITWDEEDGTWYGSDGMEYTSTGGSWEREDGEDFYNE